MAQYEQDSFRNIGCYCYRRRCGACPKHSADDLAKRAIERRCVEAMIWGLPAVNTDLMLQAMLDSTKAKVNEIVYWSRPVLWKNQTLTPNPDSIYFMSFWNVKDGPLVIGRDCHYARRGGHLNSKPPLRRSGDKRRGAQARHQA